MKKITKTVYILAGVLLLLGINSCNNDYLKVDHYSILAADQMFKSDEDAKAGLVGCYTMMLPTDIDGDWGIKPNLFIGGHPTMDTQATGWDKDWNSQNWTPGSPELLGGWKQAYTAISRCNDFLAGLEKADKVTASVKASLDGQARCIRAFYYMWLAKAFGRVPMLATGETYINTPEKARAKDFTEMWDFIIADLKAAADELEWDPLSGQYGRCTKGFALSYLGEAYMWKAFRVPDQANANYTLAAAALKQVIESGKYELNPSFTTLFDPGAVWTKECIWEEVLDEGSQWNQWSNLSQAHNWMIHFVAPPSIGGWGTLYLSWEWWNCYEPGDKRREASAVTGAVTNIDPAWKSATNYGYNPYLQQSLTVGDGLNTHYHFLMGGEAAPSVWTLKYWRTTRSNYQAPWGPQQIYFKRYANVLLDYAECLFHLNGENDATAWGYINQIRERAWGNTEVGKEAALTATYLPYYQNMAQFFIGNGATDIVKPTTYPLPFNTAAVTVPDAKTYYTSLKSSKGFASPVWLVALGQERRKEFNAEWCLAPDLIRSGFMADHININYPKGKSSSDPNLQQDTWNTYRNFDYVPARMDMPIPTDELLKNKLCDQNDAYK
ncbi:outer membrane protein [Aquipluma nitroreducens]|uniref:Outer membrane protein n=1 Tax=Aquipluma nitroreducens TaxID=2010828 RepID=A0A5K7S3D7_9BACT|nr:RagB/SusD family nutrient uptake outer membrane protein [Aquipluma nitroreducens]BBE16009.1 outer membrane protein [Aquipluma nitroreducens]